ncbi:hypothetical protein V6Z11_A08G206200 [Gossypium hirsutum]
MGHWGPYNGPQKHNSRACHPTRPIADKPQVCHLWKRRDQRCAASPAGMTSIAQLSCPIYDIGSSFGLGFVRIQVVFDPYFFR